MTTVPAPIAGVPVLLRCLRRRLLLPALALSALAGSSAFGATNFFVNSDGDSGATSTPNFGDLRYCITQANLDPGSTINFGTSFGFRVGTIVLTRPLPIITTSMTFQLVGGATTAPTIDGASQFRIFVVDAPGAFVNFQNGLNLINGRAKGGDGGLGGAGGGGGAGMGAAIFVNDGNVAMHGMIFTNNTAVGGRGGDAVGALDGGGGGGGAGGNGGVNLGGGGGLYGHAGNGTTTGITPISGGGGGGGVTGNGAQASANGGGGGAVGNASGTSGGAGGGGNGGIPGGANNPNGGAGLANGGGGGSAANGGTAGTGGKFGGGGGGYNGNSGGEFGGGGGGGAGDGFGGGGTGDGGFGAGGGGNNTSSTLGGGGGFGGGGGGRNRDFGAGAPGGAFGGSGGFSSKISGTKYGGAGGGGGALGGAIFVRGGSLNLTDCALPTGSAVTAGSGGASATTGQVGGNGGAAGPEYFFYGGTLGFDISSPVNVGFSLPGSGGALSKSGTGTLTLSAANSYGGGTTVANGTLKLSGAGTLGAPSAPLAVNLGTFDPNGINVSVSNLTGTSSGQIVNSGAGQVTLTVNPDASNPVAGCLITGNVALTKLGTGTLILTSGNTYTGATTVAGGVLSLSGSGSLYSGGTLAGSSVTLNSGAVLSLARSDTFGNATTNPATTFALNGARIENAGNFFNTLGNLTLNNGSELRANGGANAGYQAFQLRGTVSAGGTTPSSITAPSGTNNAMHLDGIAGATVFSVADVTNSPAADLTVSAILGNGYNGANVQVATGLTKTGSGTLRLTAANLYTGVTTINAGTVNAAFNSGSTGTFAGGSTVTVNAAGTLLCEGVDALGYFGGNANLVVNAGTVTTDAVAGSRSSLQNTIMTGGTFSSPAAGGGFLLNGTLATKASPLLALVNSPIFYLYGPTAAFNVEHQPGSAVDLRIDSVIQYYVSAPNAPLTKAGVGILALTGGNTYPHGTLLNAGTLLVNNATGSGTGTGAVTVANTATLSGNGSLTGTVTVQSGGTLAPGNAAVGTLTVGGLTFAAGSRYTCEFKTGSNDFASVTTSNGLTLSGGSVFLYAEGTTNAFSTPGAYDLLGYVGTLGGAATNLTVANPVAGNSYTFSNDTARQRIVLNILAAPSATTGAATLVAGSHARLNATVSANGSPTQAVFQYSTDPALVTGVTTTSAQALAGTASNQAIFTDLTSLPASATLYFRVVASSPSGSTSGATLSFATSANVVPVAANPTIAGFTGDAQSVGPATLGSDSDGDALIITSAASQSASLGGFAFTASGVSFTPALTFVGSATFTYTLADGRGGSVNGTATVNVADNKPPSASITSAPPALGNSAVATISFTGTDNLGVASFEGALDGAAFATVTSPASYAGLAEGAHSFQVRARDAAGNVSPVASASWTVDLTPRGISAITFAPSLAPSFWALTGAPPANSRPLPPLSRLASGRVLFAGDTNGGNSIVYDPDISSWAAVDSLATPRKTYSATVLADGGVLVAGGADLNNQPIATAERSDSNGGGWSAAGSITPASTRHTATRLPNGKVLLVGGSDAAFQSLSRTQIFDPVANTWSAGASLGVPRSSHRAVLLNNGKVLVVGGDNSAPGASEIYDPATGLWTPAGSITAGPFVAAALLPGGEVLVCSDQGADRYDPVTGTWTPTARPAVSRSYLNAADLTPLGNGQILLAGGNFPFSAGSLSTEVYDPITQSWSNAGDSVRTHGIAAALTTLVNGQALLAGFGTGGPSGGNTAERYQPRWRQVVRPGDTLTLTFTLSEAGPSPTVLIAGQGALVTNVGGNTWTASITVSNTAPFGFAALSITAVDLAGNSTTATATSDASEAIVNLTPLERWRLANFGRIDNGGPAANGADPDGDGVANYVELAFGTNPNSGADSALQYSGTFLNGTLSAPGRPTVQVEGTDVRGLFVRRQDAGAAGLTYVPQYSADLLTWTASPVPATAVSTTPVITPSGTYFLFSVPLPAPAHFFRVRVSIAP